MGKTIYTDEVYAEIYGNIRRKSSNEQLKDNLKFYMKMVQDKSLASKLGWVRLINFITIEMIWRGFSVDAPDGTHFYAKPDEHFVFRWFYNLTLEKLLDSKEKQTQIHVVVVSDLNALIRITTNTHGQKKWAEKFSIARNMITEKQLGKYPDFVTSPTKSLRRQLEKCNKPILGKKEDNDAPVDTVDLKLKDGGFIDDLTWPQGRLPRPPKLRKKHLTMRDLLDMDEKMNFDED